MSWFLPLTLLLLEISLASAQSYQLHPAVDSGLLNASSTCLEAFNENVTCANSVGQLYVNPFYDPGDTELATLCTSTCLDSLTSHRKRVAAACRDAQYYDEYEDTYWVASYPDEFILYAYNIACLKRR